MTTPQQVFEALKVLYPTLKTIEARVESNVVVFITASGTIRRLEGTCINWGTASQYPPPEPKWRDAKPSDLQWPPKKARFYDSTTEKYFIVGTLNGYTPDRDDWQWYAEDGTPYKYCQVIDE